MENVMTKKIITLIIISVLAVSFCLSLGGCSAAELDNYEYTSIFVDAQNEDNSISFTLNLMPGREFSLVKRVGDVAEFTYTGTWRTSKHLGQVDILCTVEAGSEDGFYPYFSAETFDDGTLVVTSGAEGAFGKGGERNITMILFK